MNLHLFFLHVILILYFYVFCHCFAPLIQFSHWTQYEELYCVKYIYIYFLNQFLLYALLFRMCNHVLILFGTQCFLHMMCRIFDKLWMIWHGMGFQWWVLFFWYVLIIVLWSRNSKLEFSIHLKCNSAFLSGLHYLCFIHGLEA